MQLDYLWPWAQVLHFPLKAFSHKMDAKEGQSSINFLIVLLEWKLSRRCSSSCASDFGSAILDAIVSCKDTNFSSKCGWRMLSDPSEATCTQTTININASALKQWWFQKTKLTDYYLTINERIQWTQWTVNCCLVGSLTNPTRFDPYGKFTGFDPLPSSPDLPILPLLHYTVGVVKFCFTNTKID